MKGAEVATCWEVVGPDLKNWSPTARLFATSEGQHFIIDVDEEPVPGWVQNVVRRNTAVFFCTENGGVTDLIADYEYPPGTTAAQAVMQMGFFPVDAPEPEPEPDPPAPQMVQIDLDLTEEQKAQFEAFEGQPMSEEQVTAILTPEQVTQLQQSMAALVPPPVPPEPPPGLNLTPEQEQQIEALRQSDTPITREAVEAILTPEQVAIIEDYMASPPPPVFAEGSTADYGGTPGSTA